MKIEILVSEFFSDYRSEILEMFHLDVMNTNMGNFHKSVVTTPIVLL